MGAALDLCSLAWGEREGYVCISTRDTSIPKGQRGYWVDRLLKWPDDRVKVERLLDKAKTSKRDVYWAPAVFSSPERANEAVTRSDVLFADLDEVAPKNIPKHLKPTAIWESSPGRYQAVWRLDSSLTRKAHAELNQRLTYALGADKGGWALSKVLRLPETHNHKYPDKPEVKLLYLNGSELSPSNLRGNLPELDAKADGNGQLPDAFEALKGVRLNAKTKQLLAARHTSGDRSARLWEIECLLAEQGLSAEAIAAVVQQTVWNKFEGRQDEVNRLLTEARKAVAYAGRSDEARDESSPFEILDDQDEQIGPQGWTEFDRQHTAISWLVADVWGESEVGFISGLPKAYKSWIALDLAVSVATGTRFLGTFQSKRHNVLLIQEEDPRPVLQDRLVKIGAAKGLIKVKLHEDNRHIDYTYDLPDNLSIISNQGFQITDEWLEMLEEWIKERDIKLVILDPLMMIASGGFDEFKAFEFMQKVLKPLKRLRARTGAAVVLVHHHIKASADSGARAMYGSVALWAWEEAALHLQVSGVGKVTAERFSKHSMLPPVLVEIGDVKEVWDPNISTNAPMDLYDLLSTMEAGASIDELTSTTGLGRDALARQLRALEKEGKVERTAGTASGAGRRPTAWRRKG